MGSQWQQVLHRVHGVISVDCTSDLGPVDYAYASEWRIGKFQPPQQRFRDQLHPC